MAAVYTINIQNDERTNKELFVLLNEFVERPENAGIPATSLVRNILVRKLREILNKVEVE